MKKILLPFFVFSIAVIFLPGTAVSQQLSLSNQYVVNKFSISPAAAGAGDMFEVFGSYRRDWMGIAGAPETKMISANGIIHKNMGLGGNVTSVQAGIFTNLAANLSYAYHVHLSGVHWLSLGVGIGVIEGDGEDNPETLAESMAVDVFAGLLLWVVDQGKTPVTEITTTAIKVVILLNII